MWAQSAFATSFTGMTIWNTAADGAYLGNDLWDTFPATWYNLYLQNPDTSWVNSGNAESTKLDWSARTPAT